MSTLSLHLSLPLPPLLAPPRRTDLDGPRVFRLQGVLTARECKALIAHAEAVGFQKAGLATGPDQVRVHEAARNNTRVMWDDPAWVADLWQRVAPVMDPGARGLNERLRLYRYEVGEYFHPHVDLRMDLPGGQTRSSFMLYLNDGFTGGETIFYDRKPRGSGKKPTNRQRLVVPPEMGSVLVFDHLLLHEGAEVRAGVKYALRSDVIFAP